MLDKNKDGYVTLKELKDGLKDNPNIDEIAHLLNTIDLDQNGAINYTEFIAATMNTKNMIEKQSKIQDAFSVFDKNGDGTITREELMEALAGETGDVIDPKVWEDVINECDKNGDGVIDIDEFMNMFN